MLDFVVDITFWFKNSVRFFFMKHDFLVDYSSEESYLKFAYYCTYIKYFLQTKFPIFKINLFRSLFYLEYFWEFNKLCVMTFWWTFLMMCTYFWLGCAIGVLQLFKTQLEIQFLFHCIFFIRHFLSQYVSLPTIIDYKYR